MELQCADYFIQYMDEQDDIEAVQGNARYVIKSFPCDEPSQFAKFKEIGFEFHDRLTCMKVNLKSSSEMRNSRKRDLPGLTFCESSDFTGEMFDLACSQFNRDRRFHLGLDFNVKQSSGVIRAYTEYYITKGARLYSSRYNGVLSGFIMYVQKGDEYENVLGVTAHGMAGKASAYALYSNLMDSMLENGCKFYKGWVSTTNIASLNIHTQLGAYATEAVDNYILRRE